MGGGAGVEAGMGAGVEAALWGEGDRREWNEQRRVWLAEEPRAVIEDSRKPTGSWYLSEFLSATEVEGWT